jgi:phosphatidylinositol-3-phosphatase
MRAAAALMLLATLSFACAPSRSTVASADTHVFLIVMENHTPEEALSGPFMASLAAQNGVAENYHAITHPSVPNYLALTSGSTWGVTDDSFRVLPRSDLGTQLTKAGVSWRAYMEGMTTGQCLDSPPPYDPGHNPFAFYGGQCPPNAVPHDLLAADLAGNMPRFAWITPDACHDTHSCDVSVGDDWLRQEVAQVTASKAFRSNGVLFITYDEDDYAQDNRVLTVVVTPGLGHRTSNRLYTHYSLLATIEDLLGVGRLGGAKTATPMRDLLP